MTGPVDRICDLLRIRLNGMDRRLGALKANGSDICDKSSRLIESQLDSVEQRICDRRKMVHAASETLAAAGRASPPAGCETEVVARARASETQALAAFTLAEAALDEAVKAALEAVLAQTDVHRARTDATTTRRDRPVRAALASAGGRHDAQAKWDRLTQVDLAGVRTEADLVAAVEQRYGLPQKQAADDVAIWASGAHATQ
ncbi:MAG TPA: hypothetical protein VEA41_18290 [Salinarimonas sp.]|nr:hypothetical protein [Salinarimonas sp.]